MSLMMPQMPQMMPMGYPGGPGPYMPMPGYDPMHATLQASANMPIHFPAAYQPSMAQSMETGMTATSTNRSLYSVANEDDQKKSKARIELLEKKIRAKDQLFEDALSSTVAGACGCGSG